MQVEATLRRDAEGRFKVVFRHDRVTRCVYVSEIFASGVQDDRALLQQDDRVLRINSTEITSQCEGAEVEQLVKSSGDALQVLLERGANGHASSSSAINSQVSFTVAQQSSASAKSRGRRWPRALSFDRPKSRREKAAAATAKTAAPVSSSLTASPARATPKANVRRSMSFNRPAKEARSLTKSSSVSIAAPLRPDPPPLDVDETHFALNYPQRAAPGPAPAVREGESGLPQRTLGCALEDFAAETAVELSVRTGEIIVVLTVGAPAGWSWAISPAGAGLVPSAFIQIWDVPSTGGAVGSTGFDMSSATHAQVSAPVRDGVQLWQQRISDSGDAIVPKPGPESAASSHAPTGAATPAQEPKCSTPPADSSTAAAARAQQPPSIEIARARQDTLAPRKIMLTESADCSMVSSSPARGAGGCATSAPGGGAATPPTSHIPAPEVVASARPRATIANSSVCAAGHEVSTAGQSAVLQHDSRDDDSRDEHVEAAQDVSRSQAVGESAPVCHNSNWCESSVGAKGGASATPSVGETASPSVASAKGADTSADAQALAAPIPPVGPLQQEQERAAAGGLGPEAALDGQREEPTNDAAASPFPDPPEELEPAPSEAPGVALRLPLGEGGPTHTPLQVDTDRAESENALAVPHTLETATSTSELHGYGGLPGNSSGATTADGALPIPFKSAAVALLGDIGRLFGLTGNSESTSAAVGGSGANSESIAAAVGGSGVNSHIISTAMEVEADIVSRPPTPPPRRSKPTSVQATPEKATDAGAVYI